MQVGIITLDGREIGVVTFNEGGFDEAPSFSEPLSGHPAGYEPMASSAHSGHRVGHRSGHVQSPEERKHNSIRYGHHERRPGSNDAGSIPYSSSGNPFDRSRFAKELEAKPWLREKMAHISLGENQDPRANTAVLETMMNRAVVRGTSLEAQVKRHRSSGVDEGGYYAGYAPHFSDDKRKMFDRNLGNVLAGSNVSSYATDNSSGDLAARERATGAFVHHTTINGENFFSPGHAEPAFRDRWQQLNRRATEVEQAAAAKPTFDPQTQVP